MTTPDTTSSAPTVMDPNTVPLDTPIKRGDTVITHITLRKPNAGELRGTLLQNLCNMDVDSLVKVLPRISTPTLIEADIMRMDPADLVQLAGVFSGFLTPKALRAPTASPTE